eukprot:8-Chlamydomonas_euryale.AAC.1
MPFPQPSLRSHTHACPGRLAAAGMRHASCLCHVVAGAVDAAVGHWTASVREAMARGGPAANGAAMMQVRSRGR